MPSSVYHSLADGPNAQTHVLASKSVRSGCYAAAGTATASSMAIKTEGRSYLAMVYTDQGQFGQAQDLLAEARVAAKDWLFTPVETALVWAEARLATAEERWAEALITFESLVETCAQYDMRWARARILIDWAAAHASRGGAADLSSARSLLQESHTMFQEMGISRYAELIQERSSVLSSEA